jgi:uncharacterized protein YyaL (SSP411 family)
MTNQLAGETSPYLLQHAHNPVNWWAWSEQALTAARDSDRPILLSIGYSACHWCHVMAHESFEDADVAAVMNDLFVNIKVDREERPDLDQVYQAAHQLLTGRPGGWPLTLFLTPDGTPFFAGTYFPKTPRHGLPGFPDLCRQIAEIHRTRPQAVADQNRSLRAALTTISNPAADAHADAIELDTAAIDVCRDLLLRQVDFRFGGFGGAPKFPHATDIAFLLRRGAHGDMRAREAAVTTLTRMAEGGLYDQLGGGFYRYSVDERWEIPHFEKMLYDNGPLLGLYADAWALTAEPLFARVVEETVTWVEREMQLADGGFASSLDADSEGEEGRYYLWDPDQVRALLTAEEWAIVSRHWGLDGPPNFENERWHLRVAKPLADDDAKALAAARAKLLARREQRIRPGCDDKVLTAWNALMIEGLARAARVFGRTDWLASARRAMDFLLRELRQDGRLLATWRAGRAHLPAYLDDHAFLLAALIELMQADFRPADLATAMELAQTLIARFEDSEHGGFFFTAHDHEVLIQRPKPGDDNSLPAGNAVAARSLLRLGALVADARYVEAAERTLRLFRPSLSNRGAGVATLLMALEEAIAPLPTAILRGPADQVADWAKRLAHTPGADALVLPLPNGLGPLPSMLDKPASTGVNAWVCSGVTCMAPILEFDELCRALQAG